MAISSSIKKLHGTLFHICKYKKETGEWTFVSLTVACVLFHDSVVKLKHSLESL